LYDTNIVTLKASINYVLEYPGCIVIGQEEK